jgi:hypothetical protein
MSLMIGERMLNATVRQFCGGKQAGGKAHSRGLQPNPRPPAISLDKFKHMFETIV